MSPESQFLLLARKHVDADKYDGFASDTCIVGQMATGMGLIWWSEEGVPHLIPNNKNVMYEVPVILAESIAPGDEVFREKVWNIFHTSGQDEYGDDFDGMMEYVSAAMA
jgi:hypothetical protein